MYILDPLPTIENQATTVAELAQLVNEATTVVAFTGAGISTRSGIPDFRSDTGLWKDHDPMKECSLGAFQEDPVKFWKFYHSRLVVMEGILPNEAHLALVELSKMGKCSAVVTQNIDGLHIDAGSENVYEIHGSPRNVSCLDCGYSVLWDEAMSDHLDPDMVPRCPQGHPMKPDVVLFGEYLNETVVNEAAAAMDAADLVLAIGSSLVVQPAAGMIGTSLYDGSKVVVMTRDETPYDEIVHGLYHDDVADLLPELVATLQEQT